MLCVEWWWGNIIIVLGKTVGKLQVINPDIYSTPYEDNDFNSEIPLCLYLFFSNTIIIIAYHVMIMASKKHM